MNWTKKDILLFNILNSFGEKYLETQINEASSVFAKMKVKPQYIIFGYYSTKSDIFTWLNNMNNESLKLIKKGYISVFKTIETINKLCKSSIKLNRKYMNVIAYLLDIINASFRVVRFKKGDNYIYALAKLEGLKEIFNFDEFEKAMFIYRYSDKLTASPASPASKSNKNNIRTK